MRKFIPILTLFMALACVSCGEKQQESSVSSSADEIISETSPQRIVNNYDDGILVGQWRNEQTNIMIFNEDGSADAVMDVSAVMHFTENNTLMLDTNEISADFVHYDGSVIDVSYKDEETGKNVQLMLLERKDKTNQDSMNGRYSFTGGQLFDRLCANLNIENGNSSLDLIINGNECQLYINNAFSYVQDGDIIDFTGFNAPFKTQSHGDCYFILDGDTLTIVNNFTDEKATFERMHNS